MSLEEQFRKIARNITTRPVSKEERFGSSEAGNNLQESLNPDFSVEISVYSLSVSWQDYLKKHEGKTSRIGELLRIGNTKSAFYYFLEAFLNRLNTGQDIVIINELAQNNFDEKTQDYNLTTTYYFDQLKNFCDQNLRNGKIVFKKETLGGNDGVTLKFEE